MQILEYFKEMFTFLQRSEIAAWVMTGYVVLHLLAIVMRVTAHLFFRTQSVVLMMDMSSSRELKKPDDVKRLRSSLLKRVIAEYVRAAEKNPARVPLEAVVDKQLSSLSLFGWRLCGLCRLIEQIEFSLVFIGLVTAVVYAEYAVVFGVLAVAGFILVRVTSAFFDYDSVRRMLYDDCVLYVEREVGVFYAGHVASSVRQFGAEVAGALSDLNISFRETIEAQNRIMLNAIEKLNNDNAAAMSNLSALTRLSELSSLTEAVETVNRSNVRNDEQHSEFMKHAQIIERTQAMLEAAMTSYETALQGIVRKMGDGMGAFMEMHGQNAAQAVNDALSSNLSRVAENNTEILRSVTALFEQLQQQNRDISAHLRALHERINEI